MRVLSRPLGGVPKESRPLIVSSLVDSTGTGLFISGAMVFFTRSAGLSVADAGLGLTLAGVCGVLGLVPLGMLTDRIGPRRMAVLLHFWQALGFAGYAFVHSFGAFLVVACLLGIPAQAVLPVAQVFMEHHAGAELRIRLMAVFRAIYNIGFTLGALLTTLVLALDNRGAYVSVVLGDAASFLLAGFLLLRVPLMVGRPARAAVLPRWPKSLRQRRYLVVSLLNAVLALHISLLAVGIPTWTLLHTRAPRVIIGPLFMVNTALVVLLQVRFSRGADSLSGGARAMRSAAVSLAACCIVLATASSVNAVAAAGVLAAGTILLTLGELFQAVGGLSLSYNLAPPDRQGEYLAVFGLGKGIQFIVGPALITIGVIGHGAVGWLVLALGFLAAGWVTHPAVRAADAESREAARRDAARAGEAGRERQVARDSPGPG